MMKRLKQLVKDSLRLTGFRLSRIEPATFSEASPLLHHRIDVVLDVGANTGQYAIKTREYGYRNRIISFEPLSEAYRSLTVNARHDARWTVHERCAVGSICGETEINIAQNSQSSSLLPMLPAHSDTAPEARYVGKEKVKVITIDSVFPTYSLHRHRVFLKIDTQGFERQVLEGSTASFSSIVGVQLELSVVPLYGTQDLYGHFFKFFAENGFELWALNPGFTSTETGRMLQFDATFVRCDLR